jgi:hypothetical protein
MLFNRSIKENLAALFHNQAGEIRLVLIAAFLTIVTNSFSGGKMPWS